MATFNYIILRNSVEQATWEALSDGQRAAQTAWETSGSGGSDPGYFQGKKFKVLFGGYQPTLTKEGSYTKTVGGKIDVGVGHVFYESRYNVRTRNQLVESDTTAHFGTQADLETYFKLNNPNPASGQPSNIVTLVDHYGVEHDGVLVGDHAPEPLTTTIEGLYALFTIQISFMQTDAVA